MALETPTPDEVRGVIALPTTVVDATINAFISDASLVVARCPVIVSSDSATQKAVIKWVTAHLMNMRYGASGPLVSESIGDASKSYAQPSRAPSGLGLAGSYYGQQALLLDPSGCLAQVGKMRPTFAVI